ncbi:hypothetical protein PbJCM13498_40570 [Prolixibacter bellariivorans]|uniref:30S ribosomal protein S16 n=2 Tax=Prolixibacter bellariivorans TaxID=314319 RepID=A0A5M4B4Y3_9BACT|nr:hypothetical protein PbJCM13498_40570 [Prolixibacter bellariivorans]
MPRGKRKQKHYWIVVADARAPLKGKFIEKVGLYRTYTIPSTYKLNFERALYWLRVGAQPTYTARSILKKAGVIYKMHLLNGVKKGAFSEEYADKIFKKWIDNKNADFDKSSMTYAKQHIAKMLISSGEVPTVKSSIIEGEMKRLGKRHSIISEEKLKLINYRMTSELILIVKENFDIANHITEQEKTMQTITENENAYNLGVEVYLAHEGDDKLYADKEYDLKIAVKVDDPLKRDSLLKQFVVIVNPTSSYLEGPPFKKIEFNSENIGEFDVKFTPQKLGAEFIEIEFLQDLETIKKIPMTFQIISSK